MERRTLLQIRVGMFVSIALVLGMIAIFLISKGDSPLKKYYSLKAKFDNTTGLAKGSPVQLAGIRIGSVEKIEFAEDIQDKSNVVTLRIAEDYKDRVRKDTLAAIVGQGFLGDKMILLTKGASESAASPGDFLGTKKGIDFEELVEKGPALLDKAIEAIDKATQTIDEVRQIAKDVREKNNALGEVLYGTQLKDALDTATRTLKKVEGIMDKVEKGEGLAGALLNEKLDPDLIPNITKTVKNLAAMAESARKLTSKVDKVIAKIDKGEGTIGALINDPTLFADLKQLLGKANRSKLVQAAVRYVMSQKELDTIKSKKGR